MHHIADFFGSVLNGKLPAFTVFKPQRIGRLATVSVKNRENVKKATFCYTEDASFDTKNWTWHTIDLDPARVFSVPVPENCRVCFFEFSDGKTPENVYSSDLLVI